IEKLAREDAAAAQLVKLRYFAGLSVEQAAELTGVSRSSAYEHWAYARAWLYRELYGTPGGARPLNRSRFFRTNALPLAHCSLTSDPRGVPWTPRSRRPVSCSSPPSSGAPTSGTPTWPRPAAATTRCAGGCVTCWTPTGKRAVSWNRPRRGRPPPPTRL